MKSLNAFGFYIDFPWIRSECENRSLNWFDGWLLYRTTVWNSKTTMTFIWKCLNTLFSWKKYISESFGIRLKSVTQLVLHGNVQCTHIIRMAYSHVHLGSTYIWEKGFNLKTVDAHQQESKWEKNTQDTTQWQHEAVVQTKITIRRKTWRKRD